MTDSIREMGERMRFQQRCVRLLFVAIALGCLLTAFSGLGFAAPKVNYLKYTNPIAYEQKSLQQTRFYASVDSTNTWAVLTVKTSRGDVILYKGAIAKANTDFWFPAWNGLGPDGKRLPTSAAYTAELTLTKGGQTGCGTTKIAVSRIAFTIKGQFASASSRVVRAYMLAGNLNCYAAANVTRVEPGLWDSGGVGSFIYPVKAGADNVVRLDFPAFSADSPLNAALYVRGVDALQRTGMRDVRVFASAFANGSVITYSLTYLQ